MKIINCDQRSEEWWGCREMRLTASHAQAIGANGKGLKTYVNQIMQEYYSSADPDRFSNKHTERGNTLESSAALLYSFQRDLPVYEVGFVIHSDHVGCSPDLFVGEKGMAEIKSPDDKAYFALLMGEKPDTKYVWQCQMQMLVCEREWNDLVFYNPNFDKEILIHREIPDPEKFEKLKEGFETGTRMIQEIQQKMDKILRAA